MMMNQSKIEILLVEDNPGDTFLIQDKLKTLKRNDFCLSHVEYLGQACDCLEKQTFDVILLDLNLPDSNGLETLLTLQNKAPNLPIVVLSGMNDENLAVEAVRQGAQDYLIKDPHIVQFLTRSIRYAIERKRTREELRQCIGQLEQQAIELEAVNKELEAFSYTVSHDLNNPLTSIMGAISLIQDFYQETLDPKVEHLIDLMEGSSLRMSHIIKDVMLLSRVKNSEIQVVRVDLSLITQNIFEQLRGHQSDRQIKTIIPPQLFARGDENLLYIALENLLGNAWKYTGKTQEPCIEIGMLSSSHAPFPLPYNRGIYFVRDNGAGFDMQQVDRLFTPFQRLHSATEFAGTGVGLSTVQRIIHRHGGRIWCRGQVDRGATFFFTLESDCCDNEIQ